MKIKISEVWNNTGESKELAILNIESEPMRAVYNWIDENRPDLELADTFYSHGFHAIEIN